MLAAGLTRRHAVPSLLFLLLLAAPVQAGDLFDLKTITDDPCPVGERILRTLPRTAVFVVVPGLTAAMLMNQINACTCTGVDAQLTKSIDPLANALGNLEKSPVITYDELEDLFGKIAKVKEKMPSNDCGVCINKALDNWMTQLEIVEASLTPARTLGRGGVAASVTLSALEIDEVGGERVSDGEGLEVEMMVFAASYGVRDRLDASVIVPFLALDLPASLESPGRKEEIGDITLAMKYQVLGKTAERFGEPRFGLSVWGDVTFPSGDEQRFAGTGHWGERLGAAFDRVIGGVKNKNGTLTRRYPVFVPQVSAWLSSRAGELGWGFESNLDLTWSSISTVAGLAGQFDETDNEAADDYLDAIFALRFRATSRAIEGTRLDLLLRHERPLKQEGGLPNDGSLSITVAATW